MGKSALIEDDSAWIFITLETSATSVITGFSFDGRIGSCTDESALILGRSALIEADSVSVFIILVILGRSVTCVEAGFSLFDVGIESCIAGLAILLGKLALIEVDSEFVFTDCFGILW